MSGSEIKGEFREPWHAQALATAMSLQDEGLFTAAEWSQALGAAIREAQAAGDADKGDTYYSHVLEAIETLLIEKQLVATDEISVRKDEWADAFRATPHGAPVHLANRNKPI